MPARLLKVLSICLGFALMLGACSRIDLAYRNLDRLVPWSLGDYLDMNREQKTLLDDRLRQHLAWHCQTQLPGYLDWLDRLRTMVADNQVTDQALQQRTGATHAAAWCSPDGRVQLVREDVGRHNALDKLVGAMVESRVDPRDGFCCITSRASVEMVRKAVAAGITALVAVSAPTARAVDTARRARLALAGFARRDDLVLYSDADRFGNPTLS